MDPKAIIFQQTYQYYLKLRVNLTLTNHAQLNTKISLRKNDFIGALIGNRENLSYPDLLK